MRRNYNTKQYENIVRRAVDSIPSLGLGADVIVGFPGESEASFEHTRKLIEELPFSYLHVFSYSPRSGTEAHNFKNNIKNITKKERNLILSDLVKEKAQLFYKSFVGKKVTVLIEERKQADGALKGHSEHYIPVRIDAEDSLQNQLVSVLITEIRKNELVGCLES
jgi:threonylcarbamoyladenosine tRNA methylthiotransferase MtaB